MRKRYLPIMALLLTIWVLFPDGVFAQTIQEHGEDVANWYGELLHFLSWLRVIPATVAGKLMTNEFVYGEVFGMTGILWRMRQVMRVFAYFVLGFVFIALLIKHIIVQDEGSKMFATLKKTVVAGILIQMTWFIMAVLVDLSIVLTAAVGSIPLQTMQQQRDQLQYKFHVPVMEIKSENGKFDITKTGTEETTLTLAEISPNAESVGGSLVFLGAGVMRLMDARFIEGGPSAAAEARNKNYSALVVGGGLKLGIIIVFAGAMILLAVINVVRIFWIWIWIMVAPFLVIDIAFNGPLQKGEHADKFKPAVILGLIFQPVAVVGLLSLGLIMIVGILDSLLGGEQHKRESLEVLQAYIIGDAVTQVGTGANGETFIIGELFKDLGGTVGGFVGEMILALFAILLLFGLIYAATSFNNLTKGIATAGFQAMRSGLMMTPLPLVGSLGSASRGLQHVQNKLKAETRASADTQANDALRGIYSKFGINDPEAANGGMSPEDAKQITANTSIRNGSPQSKTKAFFGAMHALTKKKALSYQGDTKKFIQQWFDNGGKDYLNKRLQLGVEAITDGKVKRFINQAMSTGDVSHRGTDSILDSSTTWGTKKS